MRSFPRSFTARRRKAFWPLLLLFFILCTLLSLGLGSTSLSLRELVSAMGTHPADTYGSAAAGIFWHVRAPRTAAALLAGCALAVSGAVIQSVLFNPLASPNIIGVNAGAGLGVVLCLALWPAFPALSGLGAFLGAFGAAVLVFFAAKRVGASRTTLILAGVAVNAILNACIDGAITLFPDAVSGFTAFRIGGVRGVTFHDLFPAWAIVPACLALLVLLHTELDVLCLGDDTAAGLGLRAGVYRLIFLATACALAASAVSFAGLIGFVGLVVPHVMRRLFGSESARLLPACAIGGAAMTALCDVLARLILRPYELPLGVVLALLGGPFFLYLLTRRRRNG